MCDNEWCAGHNTTHAEREQHILDTILAHGHQILGIMDGDYRFFYSIGRSVKYQPELIINGPMPPPVAGHMINEAARMQDEDGIPLAPGYEFPPNTLIENYPVRVVAVDAQQSQMFQAINLFGEDVEALQLVWPDTNGHWPDEPEYDERFVQPIFAA